MFNQISLSDSYLFAFFCFFLILFYNILYLNKKKDLSWLFFNVHGFSLFFFFLQQSSLLNLPNLFTSISLIISLLLFPLGYHLFNFNVRRLSIDQFYDVNVDRLFFLNRLGYIFFIVAFTVELKAAGWVFPLFAVDKLVAYYNFPQQFVHYLVVAIIPISIVYSYLAFVKNRCGLVDHLFILISMLLIFTILARAVLMTQVFCIAYFYFVGKGKTLNFIKIVFYCLIILAFITISGYYRTGDSLRVILDIGGLSHWPTWMVGFSWPYLYFSTSIENFRYMLENVNLDYVLYGFRNVIIYVYTLFQMKDEIPYSSGVYTSAQGFNTFGIYYGSFVNYYYLYPLSSFIFGVMTALIANSNNITLRLFCAYWVYCIFTSSINNYISSFFTLIYFLYLAVILLVAGANRGNRSLL